jgi:membrane-associated phospholipid phosphatase
MNKSELSFNKKSLTFICAVFLIAFLLVTFFRGNFHSFDVQVNVWIPSIQSSPLTIINEGIAAAFDTTSLVLFSLIISGYLFFKNYRAEGLLLLGAMGGDALLVSVVKGLVQSPRPLNGLVAASGFSYPSGHVAGSIVFCGSLAFIAWQHWKNKKERASIGTVVVAVSSVVGFNRIYLNVHWFSDVLGAGMLGIFWLFSAILAFQFLQDRAKFDSERFRSISWILFILATIISVFIVVYSLRGHYFP